MAKVAWIGLGVMGFPMAGHLAVRGGHDVTVYNRTPSKAEAWMARYATGRAAPTPAAAAEGADVVITCVGNDDDLADVTIGDAGAFSSMAPGSLLVDHTTASAEAARRLHAAGQVIGVDVVDAPVSGGQAGAENGKLTIMCGAEEEPFRRAEPILAAYARKVSRIGEPGSGQLTKMVNQIAIAGLVQALSEAIHFAERAGLDLERVMDTISKGAAQSWQMENRWKTMHARSFDFGFAVDWMRKDLGICLAEARKNGAELPVTTLVDTFYGDVQKAGGARWDTSSLITRLGRKTVC